MANLIKSKKILIPAIVGIFLLAVGLNVFLGNRELAKMRASMEDMPEAVDQKILSFDLANYAEDGTKRWRLKGDSADILAEIVNLQNIDMDTYEDPRMTVNAVKGSYDTKNKEISLFKDVVVLTSDGAMLTTDYLKWHGLTDTITTDKHVKIVRSDVIADGNGAKAFPQMKRIILNEDVTVKIATNIEAVITCDGPLDIDYDDNIAIFNNNVIVDDKKGKIYAEKMEAFLDPVSKNIMKVVAEGDVKVVRGEDSTYSEKAIYTTEDQRIILVGRPKIYIRSAKEIEKIEEGLGGIR